MTAADRELAVAYLLGELEPAERAEFEGRLADDAELRDHVDELSVVVARLEVAPEEVWEAQSLPALSHPETGVAAAPSAMGDRVRRRRASLRLHWPVVAGAVAGVTAIVVAAVLMIASGGTGELQGGETFELRSLQGAAPGATATVELASPESPRATFTAVDLPASPEGHHYELWLLGSGDPVALGSFDVDRTGGAVESIDLPSPPAGFDAFDVSIERDDGDPSHSGDSVLRGSVSQSS